MIDLDDIQDQINKIRQQASDIARRIAELNKGVLGATDVKTGVLPAMADFGNM